MSATLNDPRIAAGMSRQFELRKQKLDAGAKQIGWKVGDGALQDHRARGRLPA
jgi:hypothetical protein